MADWAAVSRELIIHDLGINDIYDAYIEAVSWYTDLITASDAPGRDEDEDEEV
jgi:hypothetical protein